MLNKIILFDLQEFLNVTYRAEQLLGNVIETEILHYISIRFESQHSVAREHPSHSSSDRISTPYTFSKRHFSSVQVLNQALRALSVLLLTRLSGSADGADFSFDWNKCNGHKLKHRKFQLNTRKNFFPLRLMEPWNRLPTEVVESPSLEIGCPGGRQVDHEPAVCPGCQES